MRVGVRAEYVIASAAKQSLLRWDRHLACRLMTGKMPVLMMRLHGATDMPKAHPCLDGSCGTRYFTLRNDKMGALVSYQFESIFILMMKIDGPKAQDKLHSGGWRVVKLLGG
jgi:hypothetical protein